MPDWVGLPVGIAVVIVTTLVIIKVRRFLKADDGRVDLGRDGYTGQIRQTCPMCGLYSISPKYDAIMKTLTFACDCGYTWSEPTLEDKLKDKAKRDGRKLTIREYLGALTN